MPSEHAPSSGGRSQERSALGRFADRELAEDLRTSVNGEVRLDDGARAMYATDASNYRHVPIGVVLPLSVEDMVRTIATCRRHDAPIVTRRGGTSRAGQACNEAVVARVLAHPGPALVDCRS